MLHRYNTATASKMLCKWPTGKAAVYAPPWQQPTPLACNTVLPGHSIRASNWVMHNAMGHSNRARVVPSLGQTCIPSKGI